MPNVGRPSQDCHLCRQRRVKCDLGRPACQRCVKYGVECPGYRDQHELVFRNADPSTVKKRRKRAATKEGEHQGYSKSSSSASTGSSTPASSVSNAASTAPTTLSRSLTEHWTNHSIPILLNVYSTIEFLVNICRINPRNGPLVWATHLFTRTYVTNIRYPVSICKELEAKNRRELGTCMGKTLSEVNMALKDPEGAFRDDVLAAVWILASYELLVGSTTGMNLLSPWHHHTRGLYSILKARGTEQLSTPQGRAAFWPCFHKVQIHALISDKEYLPESDEWLGVVGNYPYDGKEFLFHVSVFIAKCTHVQATLANFLRRRDLAAAEEQFESLVAQLMEAEKHVNIDIETAADRNRGVDIYMRNCYGSAVIKVYSHVLTLANYLAHYPPSRIPLHRLRAQRTHCLQMVRAAGQFIVDSVPCALGPLAADKDKSPKALFDAMKMVWPLTAVYIAGATLPEQKSEAEASLAFIGKELGVMQALSNLRHPTEARQPLGLAPVDDATPPFTGR